MLSRPTSSSVISSIENSEYEDVIEKYPSTSYLSLKSSVLSPVCTRLTNQYLVLQQLNAHYQMIDKAKAFIDTSPPKSMENKLNSHKWRKRQYQRNITYINSESSWNEFETGIHSPFSMNNYQYELNSYSDDSSVDDSNSLVTEQFATNKTRRQSNFQYRTSGVSLLRLSERAVKDLHYSPTQKYRHSLDLLNRREEKYLNFMYDVTEDILNRGIYTDGAIKKAFTFHMKQQKDLNMDIMKQLMDQFLDDLCISKEETSKLYFTSSSVGRNTPPERDNLSEKSLSQCQDEC